MAPFEVNDEKKISNENVENAIVNFHVKSLKISHWMDSTGAVFSRVCRQTKFKFGQ